MTKGVRVLCVSGGHLLLVQHENAETGERFWLLPGGGIKSGETFTQAAEGEALEETGVAVRVLRHARIQPGPGLAGGYALFLATPVEPMTSLAAAPRVDLASERYLRAAAWHPVALEHPLGPLDPHYWGFVAPLLRRLLPPH